MWNDLQFDVQNLRNDTTSGVVLFLVLLVFLAFYFYFIIYKRILPLRLGGLPLAQSTLLRVGLFTLVVFSTAASISELSFIKIFIYYTDGTYCLLRGTIGSR